MLQEVPRLSGPYDLVFHDAFSPRKVPHLWSHSLFKEYRRFLEPGKGQLLTYSRARDVRETLEDLGFHLEQTAPLGRKRGGTLAMLK